MRVFERTESELFDCMKCGKLYIVCSVYEKKIITERVRQEGGKLYSKGERRLFEKAPQAKMKTEPGDYIFLDNPPAGRQSAVSLLKIRKGRVVHCDDCGNAYSEGEECTCKIKSIQN